MIYKVKRLFKVDNKNPFRIFLSILLRRRSIRSLTAAKLPKAKLGIREQVIFTKKVIR